MRTTVIILSIAIVLGTMAMVNAGSVQDALGFLSTTQKGELFLLSPGQTQTIQTQGGHIEVRLIEIATNPMETYDVSVDNITFSSDNPAPGENVHITVPITNHGPGIAHAVSVSLSFGDDQGGESGPTVIAELAPGQTTTLEYDHVYNQEGVYTVMAAATTWMDPDVSNNVLCQPIRVGNPEGGGSGCGSPGQPILPKDAHMIYKEYRAGHVIDQQELWLAPQDIGSVVEVMKLSDTQALLSVPR